MTYQSAQALRTALESRLLTRSTQTGISLDRLRRRVIFERIIARVQAAEPGHWDYMRTVAGCPRGARGSARSWPTSPSAASNSTCPQGS
jgi:hypothetical protein